MDMRAEIGEKAGAPPPPLPEKTEEERMLGRLIYVAETFVRDLGKARVALNNARQRAYSLECRLLKERELRIAQSRSKGIQVLKWQAVAYRLLTDMTEDQLDRLTDDAEYDWVAGWFAAQPGPPAVPEDRPPLPVRAGE